MRTRKKKTDNTEYDEGTFAALDPESPLRNSAAEAPTSDQIDIGNFSKLDLFALFASPAVAKKMDDPARIAHESYSIAKEMVKLSNLFAEIKSL